MKFYIDVLSSLVTRKRRICEETVCLYSRYYFHGATEEKISVKIKTNPQLLENVIII